MTDEKKAMKNEVKEETLKHVHGGTTSLDEETIGDFMKKKKDKVNPTVRK